MQNFVSYVTKLGFHSIEVMTVPPESYNRSFLEKIFQIFVSPSWSERLTGVSVSPKRCPRQISALAFSGFLIRDT